MEYLKKTEFTGCHQGMRYRLEGCVDRSETAGAGGTDSTGGKKKLRCTVWPEPFSFFKTPEEKKEAAEFPFGEDGVEEAISWMNSRLSEEPDKWERAQENWDAYQ